MKEEEKTATCDQFNRLLAPEMNVQCERKNKKFTINEKRDREEEKCRKIQENEMNQQIR